MGWVHDTNARIAASAVGRYFRLQGSGHVGVQLSGQPLNIADRDQPKARPNSFFFTEVRAGLATFFAMAYIISVNATIVSDSGGTCVCPPSSPDLCDTNQDYQLCLAGLKRDLTTATAAIAALTTFCMGLFANMPIGLAPGMGLNAVSSITTESPLP